ncbi:MAG: hypothetical protein KGL54_07740 [Sphingomonadales bacterium]|nr:hypothetical protein [Sphingomonadales bacterium]
METSPSSGRAGRRRAMLADGPALTLLFRNGARPDAAALSASLPGIAVTAEDRAAGHPEDENLALVMHGWKHPVFGLAPAPPARSPHPRHGYDIVPAQLGQAEAVRVMAASGLVRDQLLAAVRTQIALGCELARLPGLLAIGWEPAATALSPAYYLRVMQAWLAGGAFPGLGLAALERDEREVRSHGFSLFAGHEIAVTLAAGEGPAGAARLALRAMHGRVEAQCAPERLTEWLGLPHIAGAFSADGRVFTIG